MKMTTPNKTDGIRKECAAATRFAKESPRREDVRLLGWVRVAMGSAEIT